LAIRNAGNARRAKLASASREVVIPDAAQAAIRNDG
jgi:hypothetical protein